MDAMDVIVGVDDNHGSTTISRRPPRRGGVNQQQQQQQFVHHGGGGRRSSAMVHEHDRNKRNKDDKNYICLLDATVSSGRSGKNGGRRTEDPIRRRWERRPRLPPLPSPSPPSPLLQRPTPSPPKLVPLRIMANTRRRRTCNSNLSLINVSGDGATHQRRQDQKGDRECDGPSSQPPAGHSSPPVRRPAEPPLLRRARDHPPPGFFIAQHEDTDLCVDDIVVDVRGDKCKSKDKDGCIVLGAKQGYEYHPVFSPDVNHRSEGTRYRDRHDKINGTGRVGGFYSPLWMRRRRKAIRMGNNDVARHVPNDIAVDHDDDDDDDVDHCDVVLVVQPPSSAAAAPAAAAPAAAATMRLATTEKTKQTAGDENGHDDDKDVDVSLEMGREGDDNDGVGSRQHPIDLTMMGGQEEAHDETAAAAAAALQRSARCGRNFYGREGSGKMIVTPLRRRSSSPEDATPLVKTTTATTSSSSPISKTNTSSPSKSSSSPPPHVVADDVGCGGSSGGAGDGAGLFLRRLRCPATARLLFSRREQFRQERACGKRSSSSLCDLGNVDEDENDMIMDMDDLGSNSIITVGSSHSHSNNHNNSANRHRNKGFRRYILRPRLRPRLHLRSKPHPNLKLDTSTSTVSSAELHLGCSNENIIHCNNNNNNNNNSSKSFDFLNVVDDDDDDDSDDSGNISSGLHSHNENSIIDTNKEKKKQDDDNDRDDNGRRRRVANESDDDDDDSDDDDGDDDEDIMDDTTTQSFVSAISFDDISWISRCDRDMMKDDHGGRVDEKDQVLPSIHEIMRQHQQITKRTAATTAMTDPSGVGAGCSSKPSWMPQSRFRRHHGMGNDNDDRDDNEDDDRENSTTTEADLWIIVVFDEDPDFGGDSLWFKLYSVSAAKTTTLMSPKRTTSRSSDRAHGRDKCWYLEGDEIISKVQSVIDSISTESQQQLQSIPASEDTGGGKASSLSSSFMLSSPMWTRRRNRVMSVKKKNSNQATSDEQQQHHLFEQERQKSINHTFFYVHRMSNASGSMIPSSQIVDFLEGKIMLG